MRMALKVTAMPNPADLRVDVMASPQEMDPSVLTFDRPASETTSEPASRAVTQLEHVGGVPGAATGGPPSPTLSPGGTGRSRQEQEFADQLSKATIGLVTSPSPPIPNGNSNLNVNEPATVRARAATSPAHHGGTSSPSTTTTTTTTPHPPKTSTTAPPPLPSIDNTGVDSIFRLLPRETRPALMAMLSVEPSIRCTLSDLLKGRGNDALVCRCGGVECGGGMNTPPGTHSPPRGLAEGLEGAEWDTGDEWLKGISCCSHFGGAHTVHSHVKIEAGSEEKTKKRFFG